MKQKFFLTELRKQASRMSFGQVSNEIPNHSQCQYSFSCVIK